MHRRILLTALLLSILAPHLVAQGSRRANVETRTLTDQQRNNPNPSVKPPVALVYVMQTIDLSQQLGGEENLMTLDGEPLPPMLARNITLGLVVDDAGHIVTRLTGISPSSPPLSILVTPQVGRPTKAKFLGLDAATGLSVLEVDPEGFTALSAISRETLTTARTLRLFGFNAALVQTQSPSMGFARPRIHSFPGRVARAQSDFRYHADRPVYRLVTPKLTPIQDGTLVADDDGAIFGIALHDTTVDGQNLIYSVTRVREISEAVVRSQGSLAHGWLGATGVTAFAPITKSPKQAPVDLGVRVTGIFPDSPAERAGVKTHDILLAINDRSIASVEQLSSSLKQLSPHSEVSLRVKRDNEYRTLRAKLAPAPANDSGQQLNALATTLRGLEDKLRSLDPADPQRGEIGPKVTTMRSIMDSILGPAPSEVKLRVRYGIEVEPLTTQLMQYFSVSGGLLITAVNETNRAARAGLRVGDIILAVGDNKVSDLSTLLKALDESSDQSMVLAVSRQREQLQLTLVRELPQ